MGSVNDKLEYLKDTKEAIRAALTEKGAEITDEDTFRSYADKIDELPSSLAGLADYFVEVPYGQIGICGIVEEFYQLDVEA